MSWADMWWADMSWTDVRRRTRPKVTPDRLDSYVATRDETAAAATDPTAVAVDGLPGCRSRRPTPPVTAHRHHGGNPLLPRARAKIEPRARRVPVLPLTRTGELVGFTQTGDESRDHGRNFLCAPLRPAWRAEGESRVSTIPSDIRLEADDGHA